tara:strand:- start:2707 stop:3198 length:492 start_codon:yes stop_codon:yes gene_type:complete
MAFIDDITDAIQDVDTGFSGNYGATNINTMKREGWDDAIAAQISENSSHVTSSTISNGAIASGSDSDWGLNHFKTNFKAVLLNGTTLFPYKATLTGNKKYMVIVNTNIHRFTDTSDAYFDATYDAVPHYCAAYFFNTKGQTSNRDLALSNGSNIVQNYNYPGT